MAKKKKVVRKPQPLPRSVKALLGYLGGSDVKIGGSGPQRAVVAPQSLLGAPQPQQQQPPQITPREKPIGTRIAESPLAKLALRPQLPSMTQIVKVKIPSGVPVIETPRESAVIKPKVEEPKLLADISQPKITEFFGKVVKSGQQEAEASSAAELISRGITGSSELLPPVKSRGKVGRPKKTEEEKQQVSKSKTAEQKLQAKEAKELEKAIAARRQEGLAAEKTPIQKSTIRRRKVIPAEGFDPSSQISAMVSGGQAAAPEQRGRSLEQLGEKQKVQ